MSVKSPICLFDMDGTLFDYDGAIRRDMRKLMSPEEIEPEDLYDESKPYLKERMDLIKSIPGWWRDLPVHKLGWEVLEKVRELNFKIKILTKGPNSKPLAWAEKVECVYNHFGKSIKPDIVGEDKSGVYGHVLVEDFPPYVLGWLKHRPRGLCIIINDKKNKDFCHDNVIRYDGKNIEEINRHLVAVTKRKEGEHWRDYL